MYKSIDSSESVIEGRTGNDWSACCFIGRPVVSFLSFKAGRVSKHMEGQRLRKQTAQATKAKISK